MNTVRKPCIKLYEHSQGKDSWWRGLVNDVYLSWILKVDITRVCWNRKKWAFMSKGRWPREKKEKDGSSKGASERDFWRSRLGRRMIGMKHQFKSNIIEQKILCSPRCLSPQWRGHASPVWALGFLASFRFCSFWYVSSSTDLFGIYFQLCFS